MTIYIIADPDPSFLPPDLAGKMRESHWILQGNTGNIWNMETVLPPGIFRIFSVASQPFSAVRRSLGDK